MRRILLVLVLVLCGLWSASQARAASICNAVVGNIVANCGFETGDFTSWTLGGNTTNPGGVYYGVDAFDANSGNYGAYMSQDLFVGTATVNLSQMLSTSAGLYEVTFWLEQDTAPNVGYTHLFSAAWAGTTFLSLTPTVALPGTVELFTHYSFTGTATAASTILALTFQNDDSFWSFDDVSATLTPEPSTGLLGGMALGVVLLMVAGEKRAASRRPN